MFSNLIKSYLSTKIEILLLFFLILIGFLQFFLGANFFVHQDQTLISNYSFGNSLGNGWRPDKGLGYSSFYGDSSWHPWSFYSLFEYIFSNFTNQRHNSASYSYSVIFVSLLSGLATYYFFKKINLKLSNLFIFLIPLVIFSSGIHGTFYLRIASFAIGIPLSLIIFNNLLTLNHNNYKIFKLSILFSFLLFVTFIFGTIGCVGIVLSTTIIYSISHIIFYKKKIISYFYLIFFFYLISVIIFFFLSAFILYSSIVELYYFDYIRSKIIDRSINIYDFIPTILNINKHSLINFLIGIFQVEWFPRSVGEGKSPANPLSLRYAYNITAIFPLIFICFIKSKSKNVWEFFFKFYIYFFLIHNFLLIFPIYNNLYYTIQSKTNLLVFINYNCYIAQLGLLILFFHSNNYNNLILFIKRKGVLFYFSLILLLFYLGIFSIVFTKYFDQYFYFNLFKYILSFSVIENYLPYEKDYITLVLSGLTKYWLQGFNFTYLIFIFTNILLIIPFIFYNIFLYFYKNNIFTILIFINAIFMSYSVYSLNYKKLAWDNFDAIKNIKFYERFYFVDDKFNLDSNLSKYEIYLNKINNYENTLDYYNKYYGTYGYEISPYFDFHGHRSFLPKNEQNIFSYLFDETNLSARNINKVKIFDSKILDIFSIKYFYSKSKITNLPNNVEFIKSLDSGLSIYKNNNAHPYFFLADNIRKFTSFEDLLNSEIGDVFIKDISILKNNNISNISNNKKIILNSFEYGNIEFSFSSNKDEIFVIADAWHPFWKAKKNNEYLNIIEANGIFKAIILPRGSYKFKLYFDVSYYYPGIYISILSFLIIFLSIILIRKK